MFRKASYIVMVATVLLSWGLLLNWAHSADLAIARTSSPEAGIDDVQALSYAATGTPETDITLKPLPKKLRN